tara:strand:+ start:3031 stop:3228 length:198 start_codon:yes stop_codon:yes gene_type:complete
MALRIQQSELSRIKEVVSFTNQSVSDFVRSAIRDFLDSEELRIMKLKAEKYELEQRINKARNKKI